MIMGHVGFGGKFDYFIHAFHMPMFFVVSGMFFEQSFDRLKASCTNPFTAFLRRKAQTLLIPYVCFGTLHYLLWLVRHWRAALYLSPLLHLMTINTYGLPITGALWFLTALFITEAVYCAVCCLCRNQYVKHIIIIMLALAGHAACYFLTVPLFWAGSAALVGLALYHIGVMFRKYCGSFTLTLTQALILGVITTALIFLNGYINMRVGVYGIIPLFYVNAVASCLVGLSFAKVTHYVISGWRLCSVLQDIGKNSIVYLCLNQLVIAVVFRLLHRASGSIMLYGKLGTLVGHTVVFVLTVVVLFMMSLLFSRTMLNALTGRTKHSLSAAGAAIIVLLLVIAGLSFIKNDNAANDPARVSLPNWNIINTEPLTSAQYHDAKTLEGVIALNLRYLLNTQWGAPFVYAFSSSSTRQPSTPTSAQERQIMRSAESFAKWREHDYLYTANTTGETAGENALRVLAHTCFVLAGALRFNIYDEGITGITRDDAARMTCKLAASLAKNHCANTFTGWGDLWQSALWAENIAFSAWLMWDGLSEQDRSFVVNMLVFEADRFIHYDVPYYQDRAGRVVFPDDTKAEENAWNSRILALAVCMLPEHEHNELWRAKLTELLLSSTAVPDDVNSSRIVDGVRLRDILRGSNVNPDGTVMNHGRYHIDYMTTTIEGMTDTSIIYALAGREVPSSAFFNHDVIYSALVNLDIGRYDESKAGRHFYGRTESDSAGVELDMPGVNDWGGKWYTSCYLADTEAEIFALDDDCPEGLKAADWSAVHLEEIDRMTHRNDTGQIFIEGENYFVSGETYAMQNLLKAYMLRKLRADGRIIYNPSRILQKD